MTQQHQIQITSLHELQNLLESTKESAEVWKKLSNHSMRFALPFKEEVLCVPPFEVRLFPLRGALSLLIPQDKPVWVFVGNGGVRIDDGKGVVSYVKSGDHAVLSDLGALKLYPVAGYGEGVVLLISEGISLEVAELKALQSPVEAPYYWGYDKRYAQTYAEGGTTWETMDPNLVVTQLIPKLVSDRGSQKIIDLGCGEGRDTLWLTAQGYDVLGVDVSSSALERARQIAQEHHISPVFLERDVIVLSGIPNNRFSVALNMGCLHMLDGEKERKKHLERVFEILESGGTFVINHCRENWLKGFWSVEDYEAVKDAVPGDFIPRKIRLADGETKTIDMEVLHYKVMSEEALKSELESVGFTDIRALNEEHFTFGNSSILICRRP